MLIGTKKRLLAVAVAAVMTVTGVAATGAGVSAETTLTTQFSRLERLEQPYVSHTFAPGELGVVNFAPVWGDKEANVASMLDYIEQAHEQGVKILLFPEMCVTGYCSSSDPDSEIYRWAVESAEPVDGPTAKTIEAKAMEYDMYIFYGATETIEGDSEHAYNSTFACTPDGTVYTYQKITPVEGSWCTPGTTPVLIDAGEYGLIGLSICYDTYATPELGRYYAAQGANLLLNPTATSRSYRDVDGDGTADDQGWEWYYKNRLESNASRDGYTVLSANLVGGDGPVRADGSSTYNFPGGSIIMNAGFSGPNYYAGANYGDSYCDGTMNQDADILTGQEGLLTNVAAVTASTGSTTSNQDFAPEWYAQLYGTLADEQEAGASLSYSSTVSDGPRAAVVNMVGVWGDKDATMEQITDYVEEAAAQDVDILVFPETTLTGYEYQDPATDSFENDDRAMQVITAETIPGPTTNTLSQLAQQYDMYIILGMTQYATDENGNIIHMYEDGVEKVYNSAAIMKPDGTIDSYQKNHRAGVEDQWSVPGYFRYDPATGTSTTDYDGYDGYMLDTQWGKIGIDICRDGHFYPELGRYYAAQGCTIFIHPTATTGNPWYRETRIGSYTDRDGMASITCNLLGGDGTYDEATGTWSGGVFASTSLIITKYHQNGMSFDPVTGSAIDLNGTGSASEGYEDRGTSPEGLEVADMDLTGTGFSISNFNPRLFSMMYDYLAALYRDGYESIYLTDGSEYDNEYDDLYASMLDVTSYTFEDTQDPGTTTPGGEDTQTPGADVPATGVTTPTDTDVTTPVDPQVGAQVETAAPVQTGDTAQPWAAVSCAAISLALFAGLTGRWIYLRRKEQ